MYLGASESVKGRQWKVWNEGWTSFFVKDPVAHEGDCVACGAVIAHSVYKQHHMWNKTQTKYHRVAN